MAADEKRGLEPSESSEERTPLSAELILNKALEVADRDGIGALSIRKLANELDVTHMAVYHYFRNKQEIVDRFLDLVIGEFRPTDHDEEDWQEWVLVTLQRFRASFEKHPAAVALIGNWGAVGPSAIQVTESVLGRLLNEGGLRPERAVRGFYTLLNYTAGYCAIEAVTKGETLPVAPREADRWIERAIARYDRDEIKAFPNIASCAFILGTFWSEEQFDEGIRQILRGLTEQEEEEKSPTPA